MPLHVLFCDNLKILDGIFSVLSAFWVILPDRQAVLQQQQEGSYDHSRASNQMLWCFCSRG